MRGNISQPVVLAVLATLVLGFASEFVSNFLTSDSKDLLQSDSFMKLLAGIIFIVAGSLFFFCYSMAEEKRQRYHARFQEKEGQFLWNIHNSAMSIEILFARYKDAEYNITEEVLKRWRNIQINVLPDPLRSKFDHEIKNDLKVEFDSRIRRFFGVGLIALVIGLLVASSRIFFQPTPIDKNKLLSRKPELYDSRIDSTNKNTSYQK